jgi:hypothetical protein
MANRGGQVLQRTFGGDTPAPARTVQLVAMAWRCAREFPATVEVHHCDPPMPRLPEFPACRGVKNLKNVSLPDDLTDEDRKAALAFLQKYGGWLTASAHVLDREYMSVPLGLGGEECRICAAGPPAGGGVPGCIVDQKNGQGHTKSSKHKLKVAEERLGVAAAEARAKALGDVRARERNDNLRDTFIEEHPVTAAAKNIECKGWDGLSHESFKTDPFVPPSVITASSSSSSSSSPSSSDGGDEGGGDEGGGYHPRVGGKRPAGSVKQPAGKQSRLDLSLDMPADKNELVADMLDGMVSSEQTGEFSPEALAVVQARLVGFLTQAIATTGGASWAMGETEVTAGTVEHTLASPNDAGDLAEGHLERTDSVRVNISNLMEGTLLEGEINLDDPAALEHVGARFKATLVNTIRAIQGAAVAQGCESIDGAFVRKCVGDVSVSAGQLECFLETPRPMTDRV